MAFPTRTTASTTADADLRSHRISSAARLVDTLPAIATASAASAASALRRRPALDAPIAEAAIHRAVIVLLEIADSVAAARWRAIGRAVFRGLSLATSVATDRRNVAELRGELALAQSVHDGRRW